MLTRALLPNGWRMAARVMFACCAAWAMIVCTSAAVKAFGPAGDEPMNGKNRASISPLMPPTIAGVNADVCAPRIGNDGRTVPGKLPKAIVGGPGALVTF